MPKFLYSLNHSCYEESNQVLRTLEANQSSIPLSNPNVMKRAFPYSSSSSSSSSWLKEKVIPHKVVIDIDSEDEDDILTNGKSDSEKWNYFRGGQNDKKMHNKDMGSPMTSVSANVDPKDMNEIMMKFSSWKKLDIVEDYSDHYYSNKLSHAGPNWAKRIHAEWNILENNLPDTISARVYESRMDLMRAVIVGAKGTPYHDGLYFFDVYFPNNYPSVPPHVHYRSGGLSIAPNLRCDGTLIGLVLNVKPSFNCDQSSGTNKEDKRALCYNETVFLTSLRTMLYNIRCPPKNFEDFVMGHFIKNGRNILMCCKAYMDGAQVGCLTEGGVQDVDEGCRACSHQFKIRLALVIHHIVNAFSQVGIKGSQELLALAQKATGMNPNILAGMNPNNLGKLLHPNMKIAVVSPNKRNTTK